ncbi:hypothetical protein M0R45_015810 [Rubus argutus]|uniref:Secreted protein n=1 Tax=Rubus argutus TaxID=59490 RepID=A0AAW1XS38_RUBAR
MNFLFWLLLIVELDAVNGGVGLEDCKKTRCNIDGPDIRFPFRLKISNQSIVVFRALIFHATNTTRQCLRYHPHLRSSLE